MVGVHQRGQMMQVFVHENTDRIGRHDILYYRLLRISLRAGHFESNIPVGDDAT